MFNPRYATASEFAAQHASTGMEYPMHGGRVQDRLRSSVWAAPGVFENTGYSMAGQ